MTSCITKSLVCCVALGLATQPVIARNASDMAYLVGARGSSGEMEMESKGFSYIDGHVGKSYSHSYWWHAKSRNCVEVMTTDGRYARIVDAPNGDCHQRSEGGGNTAAVAGAAVGIALIAALAAHKSSHHDDGRHYGNGRHDAEFERGYSDGLHYVAYHNYDRSDYYSRGYEAGVDQRNRNIGYHSGRGGYSSHVHIGDMRGRDSIWAIDEMRRRDFANVDSFNSGNTTYGVYYNRATGQCVQITNADSRVYDIRDIGTHPGCN